MGEVKNQTSEKLILNIHSLLGTLLPLKLPIFRVNISIAAASGWEACIHFHLFELEHNWIGEKDEKAFNHT